MTKETSQGHVIIGDRDTPSSNSGEQYEPYSESETSSSSTQHSSSIEAVDLTPFLPRCEFHTRFIGTTHFEMNIPEYWGTYYRSQDSRIFKNLGKSVGLYSSPLINSQTGNSPYAHSGGHSSPYKSPTYSKSIKYDPAAPPLAKYSKEMKDRLLGYKISMCKAVQTAFANYNRGNTQPARVARAHAAREERPIVFLENDYPCVLVRLPIFNKDASDDAATAYWSQHPQPLQKLIVACFVALINTLAFNKGIPIEMVMRSGFGHNLPSIDETGDTFRINVGLIPHAYADLIGQALCQLLKLIESMNDILSKDFKLSKELEKQIKTYNKARGTKIHFQGTIWEVIRMPAHGQNKSLLSELLVRNQFCAELFTDYIMEAIRNNTNPEIPSEVIDNALERMITHLSYDDSVTMENAKNLVNLEKKPWPKKLMPINDPTFFSLINELCESLEYPAPNEGTLLGLYAHLDLANLTFARSKCNIAAQDGYGSDSEFEDRDDEADEVVYGKKLRFQTGMKAILAAYHAAQLYLIHEGEEEFSVNTEYMYYETEDAVNLGVVLNGLTRLAGKNAFKFEMFDKAKSNKRKELRPKHSVILFYDLNHFNKENKLDGNKALSSRLEIGPAIVILDCTSATYKKIRTSISECLEQNDIVLLVSSGIKHDQAGADINPYGEFRIITKKKPLLDHIYTEVVNAFNKVDAQKNAVPATSHRIVRAYKRRGHAFTFFNLYPHVTAKSVSPAFIPTQPSSVAQKGGKLLEKLSGAATAESIVTRMDKLTLANNDNIEVAEQMSNLTISQNGNASAQPDSVTQSSLLKYITNMGFELHTMAGDGNCFFSSVALLLNKLENTAYHTAASIRQNAVNFLRLNSEIHIGFEAGGELGTIEDYLEKMAGDGVWAVGPIIDATSLCYKVRIQITDYRVGIATPFPILNENAADRPLISLIRTGSDIQVEHYDALMPVALSQSTSTSALAGSSSSGLFSHAVQLTNKPSDSGLNPKKN